ncbi:MAG: sugar phosphate isomerase/epimerase [Planctomycetales bacterium]
MEDNYQESRIGKRVPSLTTRREFIEQTARVVAGMTLTSAVADAVLADGHKPPSAPLYKISCTEYSLHRLIDKGELDNLDFARFVRDEFELDAVEYWNYPFFKKAEDKKYISQLRKHADDVGVQGTVILVDGEGKLGDPDEAKRLAAVNAHKKWVECARQLGCHSIRVNASSAGKRNDQLSLAADGLVRLAQFAKGLEMNVLVENHGGWSSNGKWLASVMEKVGLDNCGTLPDFGNFGAYDRYQGVAELMPYARCVSAKSHDFDQDGNETQTDYLRMMKIVTDAGYHDYVGIEYEGGRLGEVEGVKATQRLLESVREKLTVAGKGLQKTRA